LRSINVIIKYLWGGLGVEGFHEGGFEVGIDFGWYVLATSHNSIGQPYMLELSAAITKNIYLN